MKRRMKLLRMVLLFIKYSGNGHLRPLEDRFLIWNLGAIVVVALGLMGLSFVW